MDRQRTIRVTGKGTVRLRPDLTRLTLTLQGTDEDYGAILKRSAEDTETLRGALGPLGFAADALKTLQFNVDKGVYRNRFVGYQFQHTLKLEFPIDGDLLGRTLYALAHCGARPEFRISYALTDPESAKNALLSQAVKDARAKAEALTAAAGVKLGALQSIDYALGEPDLEVRPMRKMVMAANGGAESAASYDMNIDPDDISVSDSVTVLWEIGD